MNNRELKFRVWDKIDKKFVTLNIGGFRGDYSFDDYFDDTFNDPISRYSIQQFTGLKDKNGREIYEGDILKEHYFDDWGDKEGFEYIGVVRHRSYSTDAGNQFSGFVTYPNLNENSGYTGNPIKVDCEIVGNIFENTDLLK